MVVSGVEDPSRDGCFGAEDPFPFSTKQQSATTLCEKHSCEHLLKYCISQWTTSTWPGAGPSRRVKISQQTMSTTPGAGSSPASRGGPGAGVPGSTPRAASKNKRTKRRNKAKGGRETVGASTTGASGASTTGPPTTVASSTTGDPKLAAAAVPALSEDDVNEQHLIENESATKNAVSSPRETKSAFYGLSSRDKGFVCAGGADSPPPPLLSSNSWSSSSGIHSSPPPTNTAQQLPPLGPDGQPDVDALLRKWKLDEEKELRKEKAKEGFSRLREERQQRLLEEQGVLSVPLDADDHAELTKRYESESDAGEEAEVLGDFEVGERGGRRGWLVSVGESSVRCGGQRGTHDEIRGRFG